jgi:hypothetical protein
MQFNHTPAGAAGTTQEATMASSTRKKNFLYFTLPTGQEIGRRTARPYVAALVAPDALAKDGTGYVIVSCSANLASLQAYKAKLLSMQHNAGKAGWLIVPVAGRKGDEPTSVDRAIEEAGVQPVMDALLGKAPAATAAPQGMAENKAAFTAYCQARKAGNQGAMDTWRAGYNAYKRARTAAKKGAAPAAPSTPAADAADLPPVGTQVKWKREVYRMPYAQRPIDTGTVVGPGPTPHTIVVRDDRTGKTVTGPRGVFSPAAPAAPAPASTLTHAERDALVGKAVEQVQAAVDAADLPPQGNVYRVPGAFYEDHAARDLPAGTLLRHAGRQAVVQLDAESYAELLSDAQHYATQDWDSPSEMRGLVASAKATVKALRKAGAPTGDITTAAGRRANSQLRQAGATTPGPKALADLFRF